MKCEQSISRRGEGKRSGWWKVRRGRSTTDRNTKRGGGRTGSEEVWKGGRESERVMRVSSRLFVLQRLLWIQMD